MLAASSLLYQVQTLHVRPCVWDHTTYSVEQYTLCSRASGNPIWALSYLQKLPMMNGEGVILLLVLRNTVTSLTYCTRLKTKQWDILSELQFKRKIKRKAQNTSLNWQSQDATWNPVGQGGGVSLIKWWMWFCWSRSFRRVWSLSEGPVVVM